MSKSALADQVALVTGGSKGYGLGIATELQKAGARVVITGRDQVALESAAKQIGATPIVADVTSAEDWDRVIGGIEREHGKLDILINNAGAGVKIAPVDEQSVAAIQQAVAVNLIGPIFGARAAVPLMKKQGSGTIINISSICARESWPGWAVYGAAKAGLQQFSEGLYVETRSHGIRVTTLTPSWGLTDFLRSAEIPEFAKETAGKVTQPAELGRIVVDLCALPAHLCALDYTLLPLVQQIEPL